MDLSFFKYQGTGNDFVILDNRQQQYITLQPAQVAKLCDRRFGIGADGLMLLSPHPEYDFEMIYYNADGHLSTMCGNGGRCLVQAAAELWENKRSWHFIAVDGSHEALVEVDGTISLKMNDVILAPATGDFQVVNTGSPHYVRFEQDVMSMDVYAAGRAIRNSNPYTEEGINVNFVERTPDSGQIVVRTYERGVEDETLSCGTGVTASAIVSAFSNPTLKRVHAKTPGGQLQVSFDRNGSAFTNVWLNGEAKKVFEGTIVLKDLLQTT